MDNRLVSIVLPYYNGKKYIKETIESILAQTHEDFELLLVDDGSSVGQHSEYVRRLMESYDDCRLKYHYKPNGGLSDARNYGMSNSSGEFIAFIDQDDLWKTDKLEKQMKIMMANPDVQVIITDGETVGEKIERLNIASNNNLREGMIIDTYSKLLWGSFVICSSVLFRKQLIEKTGYANRKYAASTDFEYFIRMAEEVDFYFLNDSLIQYRLHEGNVTKNRICLLSELIQILFDRKLFTFKHKVYATKAICKSILELSCRWFVKVVNP
ncbi:MAG: glycosyltransferase [Pseudomonadota bacterium]